jgi:sortase A
VQRTLRIASIALITAGLVVLVDVGMTLAWKEPLSSIYGSLKQRQAEDSLAKLERQFPSRELVRRASRARDVTDRARILAGAFAREVGDGNTGEGIGRIVIPRIDLDIVVVQGTDTASLQRGPGHYPETAFPGQGRTIGIAGHRTTYLAPFRRIDEIQKGDEIRLEMPYADFTYTVQKHRIVPPTAVDIVHDTGYERLVLTACHPLYSAAERYAQFARLTDISLFASENRTWQDP